MPAAVILFAAAAGRLGEGGGYEQHGVCRALAAVGAVACGLAAVRTGEADARMQRVAGNRSWVLERLAAMRAASSSAAVRVRLLARWGNLGGRKFPVVREDAPKGFHLRSGARVGAGCLNGAHQPVHRLRGRV